MKLNRNLLVGFGFAALGVISCGSDDDATTAVESVTVSQVSANYANIVRANYADALQDAEALRTSLQAFVDAPDEITFQAAKEAWLLSRESYGTTEAFRFADGPIDRTDEVTNEEGPEGLLNSWPLDESYIDAVAGVEANTGIINDVDGFPEINSTVLADLNGVGGDENVSVGYHAIEFLLWGQDNTAPSELMAGLRSFTDYVEGAENVINADRRADYLIAVADLLIENLESLISEWAEGTNYAAVFEGLEDDVVLVNLIGSIAELSSSELAGERMDVALDNQDQEDEHSCFSDNTHRDIRLNFEGIRNVYFGQYNTISGASLNALITQTDAEIAADVVAAFNAAESAINATAIPFDFAISGGRTSEEGVKVLTAIEALRDLGDALVTAGQALDLNVNI